MENTAIINPTAFEGLKDFNLAEAIEENMDGMDISFDRIGTPGAGGTTFEVPGENPGEMDSVKEFTGVILPIPGRRPSRPAARMTGLPVSALRAAAARTAL